MTTITDTDWKLHDHMLERLSKHFASAPPTKMTVKPRGCFPWLAQLFARNNNRRAHRLARFLSISPQFKRLD